MTPTERSFIEHQGYMSFFHGIGTVDNPYPIDSEQYNVWIDGWIDAKESLEQPIASGLVFD